MNYEYEDDDTTYNILRFISRTNELWNTSGSVSTTINRTDSEDICDNTTRYEEESINTNTKKRRERNILGERTTSIERFRMVIYQMQGFTIAM